MREVLGGSYDEVKQTYIQPHNYEAHHIYAHNLYKNVLKISRGQGSSIKMFREDHRKTASCGRSKQAKDYRTKQSNLLKQGKYKEAWQMDVKDIRSKFGNKYDQHLLQAEKQLLKLDRENKIKLEPEFKKEVLISDLEKWKSEAKSIVSSHSSFTKTVSQILRSDRILARSTISNKS